MFWADVNALRLSVLLPPDVTFKVKMHRNQFRLGSAPPAGGANNAFQTP